MNVIHKNGVVVSTSEEEKTHVAFSLRIPKELADQIEGRRKISKRSRNKEIEVMLERQLEHEVERDRALMDKMAKMNLTPQSSQT